MKDSYLNIANIERGRDGVEWHPLLPFLPQTARVLFLGSFPPQRKRWCCDFFYPNFINDHWRIEGEVFYGDRDRFVDRERKCFRQQDIVRHCEERGIAFYDTATAVRRLRDNASDKYLEVVESTDVRALTRGLQHLKAIVTTGEKATETVCRYYGVDDMPKVGGAIGLENGLELYRLPSSSRAYPMAFDKKAEAYRVMFARYGLLECAADRMEETRRRVMEATDITEFQRKVYLELLNVPRGTTVSYGELARRIGCGSAQAVGQALRNNPFAPDVPCHRVIANDGSIGGFFGERAGEEIERKRRLLREEGVDVWRMSRNPSSVCAT